MSISAPSLKPQVADVFRRAQEMVKDGKNATKDVAALIGDIGKLGDTDRKELFDTFDLIKQQSGAPKGREAVEVFLGALRDKPAQLLARLEKDDGVIDLKDAMQALAQIGNGATLTGKQRVSVFTMMLVAKTTPEASAALLSASQGPIDVDTTMRALLARGNVTAEEVKGLRAGVGSDNYGAYQLNFWAQTAQASSFAPGGHAALQSAAEDTRPKVGRHYKEDLELNRGRPPSLKGARVLDGFSRETLQLPHAVSFEHGSYAVDVNGRKQTFTKPDELAAFLMETALKKGGHDIDHVRWDPKDAGQYVVSRRNVEQKALFHSEILRQFGYAV